MKTTVLLQVRAYVICDKRKALLYTFSILDVLAIVVFILEVTVIQSEYNHVIIQGLGFLNHDFQKRF